MTDNDRTDRVEVTQEDREAAADLHHWYNGEVSGAETEMRAGRYDNDERVQAFARHRLAALSGARGEGPNDLETLLLAAERVDRKYGHYEDGEACDWTEWQDLRNAIQTALATHPGDHPGEGEGIKPWGLPISDADMSRLYEGSKHDVMPVGSEVRQLIAEVRYYRASPTSAPAGDGALDKLIEREAVDIITDLIGAREAQSGTSCRVVEDHLRQLLRNAALSTQATDREKVLEAALRKIATARPIGGHCYHNSVCSVMEGFATRALAQAPSEAGR